MSANHSSSLASTTTIILAFFPLSSFFLHFHFSVSSVSSDFNMMIRLLLAVIAFCAVAAYAFPGHHGGHHGGGGGGGAGHHKGWGWGPKYHGWAEVSHWQNPWAYQYGLKESGKGWAKQVWVGQEFKGWHKH